MNRLRLQVTVCQVNLLNYSYDGTMAPKEKIASNTINAIERVNPGITDEVEVTNVATPMTTEKFTSNGRGYGSKEDFRMKDTLRRFLNKPLVLKTLKNLYVIEHSIGGTNLYGCAAMGRNNVKKICKKEKKSFVGS